MLLFPLWKKLCVIATILAAIYVSIPSFFNQDEAPEYLPDTRINLGLDLRGGSYLLLEVDFQNYIKQQLVNLKEEVRDTLRGQRINGSRVFYVGGLLLQRDPQLQQNALTLQLKDLTQTEAVSEILSNISEDLTVTASETGKIRLFYHEEAQEVMQRNLLDQSIEIVRRRVDETGTREPDIQRQGSKRILLQVPGLKDPEQLKRILGKTARLSFHLLDDRFSYPDTSRSPLPPGTLRLPSEDSAQFFAIKERVELNGDLLVDAQPGFNSYQQPVVNIRFNQLGAKKFGDITRENVGKPFAIVLDGKVLTAPRINSPILGGRAEISGSFTLESAKDLSIVLRAGALPAPLNIVEERTVGPSLGADSIAQGEQAFVAAFVMILVFMVLFYALFGAFSAVALIINIILLFGSLSLLGATLTMPGIAGVILTLGMAVDANVLIFERIREELAGGKTPYASISQGFSQAFRAIIDSNITTLIVALILFNFGTGPIKGFAVTLSVGILTSMFSAIMFTRMLIIIWVRARKPSHLVI